MTEVRSKGNYEQWIRFFLQAVAESAEDAVQTIDKLSKLHEENIALLDVPGRQEATMKKLFRYLEANPIIEIRKTAGALSLSYNAVARAVTVLMEKNILEQTDKKGKTRIYTYSAYLDILRKDTE